jgi:PilZ domain
MTNSMNIIEHRWGERVPVSIPVRVAAQTLVGIDGRLKNISLSGALMRANVDLRLNAIIDICIRLPPPASGDAVITAHVTRIVKQDVGVEWSEFAPTAVKELLRSPSIRVPL